MKKLTVLALMSLIAVSASGAEVMALKRLMIAPARPPVAPQPAPPAPKPERIPLKPGECLLQLADGVRIVGAPDGLATLPVLTDFGPVQIPLDKIKQIVASGASGSVKIQLFNGDRLTCKLRLEQFTLKSTYGALKVPVAEVTRLAFGDGSSVTVEPLDEKVAVSRPTASAGHAGHNHGHAVPQAAAVEVFRRFEK